MAQVGQCRFYHVSTTTYLLRDPTVFSQANEFLLNSAEASDHTKPYIRMNPFTSREYEHECREKQFQSLWIFFNEFFRTDVTRDCELIQMKILRDLEKIPRSDK